MIEVVGFVEVVGGGGGGGGDRQGDPNPLLGSHVATCRVLVEQQVITQHVLQEEFNKKSLTPLSVLVQVSEKKVTKDAQRANSYKSDLNINEYTLQSEFSFK